MKIKTLLGFCLLFFISCGSFQQKADFPVVANVQLNKTLLAVSIVADSLNVPWDIQLIDDHQIMFTEIAGNISKLDLNTGSVKHLYSVADVYHKRTLGLLGMCLSPDFKENPYVYISYTTKNSAGIFSKLVRLTYNGDTLGNPVTLHTIPGSTGHNGSRVTFSKDGKLLWATGDAASDTFAQDSTSLNGKILRMNPDGSVPNDNPIRGSLVYAWGFRNMQGLTVSNKGKIYTSEHGDAIEDEVNLIKPLHNYGWPQIEGIHDLPSEIAIAEKSPRTEPIRSWTPVIAPAGLQYYNSSAIPEWQNSLLLVTLKSQSFRVLKLNAYEEKIEQEQVFFSKHFGRLRAVAVAANGDVFLATSNQDWNPQPGFPKNDDDKILKLSPAKNAVHKPLRAEDQETIGANTSGAALYKAYCESCHKENGQGVSNTFPPLSGAEQTLGSPEQLLRIVLDGLSGQITVKGKTYDQHMPAFNFLKDEEIAKILTYIRSSFGNKAGAISVTDVTKARR
ncbi:quinoprotein glucose dehydrogenase [Pelobium manganitolerans]|uniref:Quinoprotein glucose dehydrogenase n=1 Tax=Pelobium manganitolerans TaxID=1842495 RepID=A0A419S2E1_9SPHI|nr:PQQ-dependent sugar dehydrogenase [Pelobium manganitolerans]RKD12906.1 quinoprotein glucose dehydrogenase [Pelobium manganitolerans]